MSTVNYCPNCGNKLNANAKFCSSCGNKLTQNNPCQPKNITSEKYRKHETHVQNGKREKVLKSEKKKMGRKGIFAVLFIVFVSALFLYFNTKTSKEEAIIGNQPVVSESVIYPNTRVDHAYSIASSKDGKVILPLDLVKERKFVKFDYIGQYSTIPLLAYLTEEGKVVTAISICEPCDSKNFHIQGSNLICNSCGTTWDLNNLEAIGGSCGKYPPDPVPSKVLGNEIQIDEYLVTNWVRRV